MDSKCFQRNSVPTDGCGRQAGRTFQQRLGNLLREESSRRTRTRREKKREAIFSLSVLSPSSQQITQTFTQLLKINFESSVLHQTFSSCHLKFIPFLSSSPLPPSARPQKKCLSYPSPSWNSSSVQANEKYVHCINRPIPLPACKLCKRFSTELDRCLSH